MSHISSDDEDIEYDPHHALNELKSNQQYYRVYEDFQKWNQKKGATPVTESILMRYFTELAVKSKPSSLLLYHSMLKSTLRLHDNIDISSYSDLTAFLKGKSAGYTPIKATIFTEEQIEKFLNEAPDEQWLDVKVVCIFRMNGVHSSNKLVNMVIDHIKVYDDLILVTMPNTENSSKLTFTVTGTFFDIMHKYVSLRPERASSNRFFLHYRDGNCLLTPIGKNKFFDMPRRIAKYLKLPKPKLYSGNSFRMAPNQVAAVHAIAWESSNSAVEPQQQYSLNYETGHLRTTRSVVYPSPPVSANHNDNMVDQGNDNVALNGSHNRPDPDTRNGNNTGQGNDHVCSISCGRVKCASEENEKDAAHAFSIMKPKEYKIIEVTAALFASDPICRWIVDYTHTTDPVSPYNTDETFDDLTRSTPNNVKVIQKYIRSKSSQLPAAYVVVYGVNCRCHKEASDVLHFEMSDLKYEV